MNRNRTNFDGVWIDKCFLKENLSITDICLYCYLYFKSDKATGKVNLTNKEISDALKLPLRTISRSIKKLSKTKSKLHSSNFIKIRINRKEEYPRKIECNYQYEISPRS